MVCRDDWHADLRSTRSKLAQAEQVARAKESEVEDLRKAYEVLLDHHHQTASVVCMCSHAYIAVLACQAGLLDRP